MQVRTCAQCDSENIKKTKDGTHGQIIHCICNRCHHEFDIAEEHRVIKVGEGNIDQMMSKGYTEIMADDGTLIKLEASNDH